MEREVECDPAPEPEPCKRKVKRQQEDDGGSSNDEEYEVDLGGFMGDEFIKVEPQVANGKADSKASYYLRPAFQIALKKGLALMPPGDDFGLWHHTSTSQWHAHDKRSKENYAPAWGGKRTEMVALLTALAQLWKWHLSYEHTPEGEAQLRKLETEIEALNS